MQVQIHPLVLVLDLEQLKLRSKEELLLLLRDHILLIIMGQLRDIKERERLSRKLCREYNQFFDAHDIVVSPRPLSTKQTDARLIAPRKLAHLIGTTTSDMLLGRNTQTPVVTATTATTVAPATPATGESSEQAAASSVWTLLARVLRFALLLIAALLPVVGISEIQSRSKVSRGLRVAPEWVPVRTTKLPGSLLAPGLSEQKRTNATGHSAVGLRLASADVEFRQIERTGSRATPESPSSEFADRLRRQVTQAPAPGSAVPLRAYREPSSVVLGSRKGEYDFSAASRSRARFLGVDPLTRPRL